MKCNDFHKTYQEFIKTNYDSPPFKLLSQLWYEKPTQPATLLSRKETTQTKYLYLKAGMLLEYPLKSFKAPWFIMESTLGKSHKPHLKLYDFDHSKENTIARKVFLIWRVARASH